MTMLARERSPDGELTLLVEQHVELDGSVVVSLGFEGAPWHIHPPQDLDPATSQEQWALSIFGDVVSNRMLIVTSLHGDFKEVSLAASLEFEVDFILPTEKLQFRFWDGRQVAIEDLIDGKVSYRPL